METQQQMSEYTGEMLAEIWNAMKPYIDRKERLDAATSFLRATEDFTNIEDFRKDLTGIDSSLDTALAEMFGEEEGYVDDEIEDSEDY
jgi:hypothetical protein